VEKKPTPIPPPVDKKQVAHEKAQKQLDRVKDELADLRQLTDLTPIQQTKNLSGAVGADSHAERSMITSIQGGRGQWWHHVRQQQPRLWYGSRLADRTRHNLCHLEHCPRQRRCPRTGANRVERQGRPLA
jgi:hypothetical protein